MTATYNSAADLLERNITAGRGPKIAFIDDRGRYSYTDLADRVGRFSNALHRLDMRREERILLCLHDGIDFPTAFLGAIKAGIVPVPVNTMMAADELAYMLADSRARAVVVSAPIAERMNAALATAPGPAPLLVASGGPAARMADMAVLMAEERGDAQTAPTHPDEPCFWLYSSGSTGRPKGTVHAQTSLVATAELYAIPILGIAESDIMFSAPKLFFAYGLGSSLTFPLSVGATSILMAERPNSAAVFRILRQLRPTIFYGVPTLYSAMLSSRDLPGPEELALRRCVSGGEPLPAEIGRQWVARTGTDILDGIGSTEMLHIFLSNRPEDVHYGSTGKPIPGYALKIVDDKGAPVKPGQIGELWVSGPSSALFYWNNRKLSRSNFVGEWTRTGDKYFENADGYYVYCGRSDDMLKVHGMYVSPAEVEAALVEHPAVLEAAVVGADDEDGLQQPKAFIVVKPGVSVGASLADALLLHARTRLAHFKCPRWIAFIDKLPKTTTDKIQRFKLRAASKPDGTVRR